MAAATAAGLVAAIAACGGGSDRDGVVAVLVDGDPPLSPEQGACVADRLIERFGLERVEADLGVAEAEVDADFTEARFSDMVRCGVQGDLRQRILDELVASGVAAVDAPCVADELVTDLTDADVDVLVSGRITSAFAEKFAAAMDACGAVAS